MIFNVDAWRLVARYAPRRLDAWAQDRLRAAYAAEYRRDARRAQKLGRVL